MLRTIKSSVLSPIFEMVVDDGVRGQLGVENSKVGGGQFLIL